MNAMGGTLGDGEMAGDIIMGDVTNTSQTPSPSLDSLAKGLIALALAGPGAYVAVKAIDAFAPKPPAVESPSDENDILAVEFID